MSIDFGDVAGGQGGWIICTFWGLAGHIFGELLPNVGQCFSLRNSYGVVKGIYISGIFFLSTHGRRFRPGTISAAARLFVGFFS